MDFPRYEGQFRVYFVQSIAKRGRWNATSLVRTGPMTTPTLLGGPCLDFGFAVADRMCG